MKKANNSIKNRLTTTISNDPNNSGKKLLVQNGKHNVIFAQKGIHHVNVETDLITLTEDKLIEIVNKYFYKYENFISSFAYFGIALSVFLTFCSSEFKNSFFGIKGEYIKYFFIGMFSIFSFLFVKTIFKMKYILKKSWPFLIKITKTTIINDFINDIKKDSNDLVNSISKENKKK